jgi:hypothetical protein
MSGALVDAQPRNALCEFVRCVQSLPVLPTHTSEPRGPGAQDAHARSRNVLTGGAPDRSSRVEWLAAAGAVALQGARGEAASCATPLWGDLTPRDALGLGDPSPKRERGSTY